MRRWCLTDDTAKTTKTFVKSFPQQTQATVYRFLNKQDNNPHWRKTIQIQFLVLFSWAKYYTIVSFRFTLLYRQEEWSLQYNTTVGESSCGIHFSYEINPYLIYTRLDWKKCCLVFKPHCLNDREAGRGSQLNLPQIKGKTVIITNVIRSLLNT